MGHRIHTPSLRCISSVVTRIPRELERIARQQKHPSLMGHMYVSHHLNLLSLLASRNFRSTICLFRTGLSPPIPHTIDIQSAVLDLTAATANDHYLRIRWERRALFAPYFASRSDLPSPTPFRRHVQLSFRRPSILRTESVIQTDSVRQLFCRYRIW